MAIGRIPEPGTGIPESIVDAKGDIVTATAADTPARLAVGTNEQRLVADSAAATGLKYVSDTTNYAVAAKGDLLVGTAADTVAVLSVGTNGHTLVADSSVSPTGLKWAAPAGGGKVLQVVGANTSTAVSTGTVGFIDTGLTATITPTLNTSKILVLVAQNGAGRGTPGNTSGPSYKLLRGATDLMTMNGHYGYTNTNLLFFGGSIVATYLDSPATTSATTYKTQMTPGVATQTTYAQEGGATSNITLLEIGV